MEVKSNNSSNERCFDFLLPLLKEKTLEVLQKLPSADLKKTCFRVT